MDRCVNCGEPVIDALVSDSVLCPHCNTNIEIEYFLCMSCNTLWKEIDGVLVSDSVSNCNPVPPEDVFESKEDIEAVKGLLKNLSESLDAYLNVIDGGKKDCINFKDILRKCPKCGTMSLHQGDSVFMCLGCQHKWEGDCE